MIGMSMGGHGAIRFAYFEKEIFDSVSAISALILSKEEAIERFDGLWGLFIPHKRIWGDIENDADYPEDLDPYVGWIQNSDLRSKSLYIAWGSLDHSDIIRSNQRFSEALTRSGLKYKKNVYEGRHRWLDWKHVIADAIRFQLSQPVLE